MNAYAALEKTIRQGIDDYVREASVFFAFSPKQYEDGLKNKGLEDAEIVSAGVCMFGTEEAVRGFDELVARLERGKRDRLKDPKFAYDAFYYELGNHEYCVTGDCRDSLEAVFNDCPRDGESVYEFFARLGFDADVMFEVFREAREDYLGAVDW